MTFRLIGVGFVGIGAIILFLSLQLPQPLAATRIAYGPGFFPTILGVVIAVSGLLMAIFNSEDKFEDDEDAEVFAWSRFIKPAVVIIAALAYILFSNQLGFLVVAPIILVTLLLMGGVSLLHSLLVGLIGPVIIYGLFAKLLLVPLPLGLFASWGGFL